jgi:tetratricopeptide (TPR) repeat protein
MRNNPAQAGDYASEGARKITTARGYAPGHADYALLAASFAAIVGNHDAAIPLLQAALANNPVRADLWAQLASDTYQTEGANAETLHALDNALYFGPREYYAHLANATVILGSGKQLDETRRVQGWNDLVQAMSIPQLSQRINRIAKNAGMERQLQAQVRDRSQQKSRNGD